MAEVGVGSSKYALIHTGVIFIQLAAILQQLVVEMFIFIWTMQILFYFIVYCTIIHKVTDRL